MQQNKRQLAEEVYTEMKNLTKITEIIRALQNDIAVMDAKMENVKSPTWDGNGGMTSASDRDHQKLIIIEQKTDKEIQISHLRKYRKLLVKLIVKNPTEHRLFLDNVCLYGMDEKKAAKSAGWKGRVETLRNKVIDGLEDVVTEKEYEQMINLRNIALSKTSPNRS